ncbi:MAG: HAMP domain-containing sensor histidine kinase [Bdellovibrionota bacterium]
MYFAKIRPFVYSLRVRLTALYIGLLALTLAVFSSVLYQVFVRNHQQEFDFALYNHAVDVSRSITVDFFGDLVFTPNALYSKEKLFPFSLGKSFAQVVSLEGQVINPSENLGNSYLPLYTEDWQEVFLRGHTYRTLAPTELKNIKEAVPGESYRLITYMIKRGKPVFILQIAVPLTLLEREAQNLIVFFLKGIPVALLLAAIFGFYLSSKALEPVRRIIKKAAELNPSNLSQRLPEPPTEDEIRRLTVTLNGLLGRIERAFESHENFIADASHQLKTPLAILRGELDVFRSKTRSPEEVTALVDSASQELQHMSRLLDDLLLLAKIDAGAGSLTMRKTRIDELMVECVGRFEVLANKKNISIRFDLDDRTEGTSADDFLVDGDSDLLQSMFRNLVDNAVKYSPEGSPIEVKVINEAGRVITQIRDFGAPIEPEAAERLFLRYERGNVLVSTVSGTGLGLTIAQRIAELHGGNISILQDNSPGKAFQVEMKKI